MPSYSSQRSTTQDFAQQLTETLNAGALALMLSIGHRTRLFDRMANLPPSTAEEIAAAAGLSERYVREWVAAMTTAGVLRCDAAGSRFELPAEHAEVLTREAQPHSLAAYMQLVGVLGRVEDDVVRCFQRGGGLGCEAFPRYHEVAAEFREQSVVPGLEGPILDLVPGLVAKLEAGISVLDVGCGEGGALFALARRFPASRFLGYDRSAEIVTEARIGAVQRGLGNVRFEVRDASTMADRRAYDLVLAFDAMHAQARPDLVLAAIADALRDEGVFLMQQLRAASRISENLEPRTAPLLYTLSCMHSLTVSFEGNGLGLGAVWGEERACAMLAAAGFGRVKVSELRHDPYNSYFVTGVGKRALHG